MAASSIDRDTPGAKAIFVLRPSDSGHQAAFRELISRDIIPRLASDPRVKRLVMNLPFDEADAKPHVPAAIEIYGEEEALRALTRELDAFLDGGTRLHAYLVSERLPRRHEQSWPDGSPSPGVRLVALMVRKPELSAAEFAAYWRDQHTPIALAHSVQVLNYSQNTVLEALTESSHPIDGIAGEHFASPSYSRERILRHPIQFARGIASARKFLDLSRTRGTLMVETVVASGTQAT